MIDPVHKPKEKGRVRGDLRGGGPTGSRVGEGLVRRAAGRGEGAASCWTGSGQ